MIISKHIQSSILVHVAGEVFEFAHSFIITTMSKLFHLILHHSRTSIDLNNLKTNLRRSNSHLFHNSSGTSKPVFSDTTSLKSDTSITIGNATVSHSPIGSGRSDLVPKIPLSTSTTTRNTTLLPIGHHIPPCHLSHLKWMLQKDLVLKQDFCLLGEPELAIERRFLILLYAGLVGREVEYVSLSRDTSEADLKQRKEVISSSTKSRSDLNSAHTRNAEIIYINQAPIRAAIHGRLLILDGLEKAERNVLPTLNNLLENRELPLDDGGMLISSHVYDSHHQHETNDNLKSNNNIHRVHPDFRVAALGSLSPGDSATLDPPLRSRFQARLASTVNIEDMIVAASAESRGLLDAESFKAFANIIGGSHNAKPLLSIHNATRYMEQYQQSVSPKVVLKAYGISTHNDDEDAMIGVDDLKTPLTHKHSNKRLTTIDKEMKRSSSDIFVVTKTIQNVHDLLIAGLDSGNRAVACVGPKGCYKSALVRETIRTSGNKATLFSLHRDMTSRDLLMVRGTDEYTGNTIWKASPLVRAVENGHWVILDGIDKLRMDTLTSISVLIEQGFIDLPDGKRLQADERFRCIALAHLPDEKNWITPEIKSMFHWIKVSPLPNNELHEILMACHPSLDHEILKSLINLKDELDQAVYAIKGAESLLLTLRKLLHICRRAEQSGIQNLGHIISNTLMISFMQERERRIIERCMSKCGINDHESNTNHKCDELNKNLVESNRRSPTNPLLVPKPIFEMNSGQVRVMNDILDAHSAGERALLISGYQGVGKNRIADFLLSSMNCEREYLQLHRDTTIQSLLSIPSVENGLIVYHDSPLVKAAKHGRILLLDEADKAPLDVVVMLKGLIEDGQLSLPDGRILCYDAESDANSVPIHPDFRIWTLTNPAGYPFHGNDLAREMADVFSCHIVPPMDTESHKQILLSYGPKVQKDIIDLIVQIWEDLRIAHTHGLLIYPFSIREAVNVVKHLNQYPDDGIQDAVENVIAFDRLDFTVTNQLKEIFGKHGVNLFNKNSSSLSRSEAYSMDMISTPNTRSDYPKFGKVDPNNSPHVGGNTWAGGTGGSDTAGLGGRGGPFRLDAGHPVHQISEEMKAEVSAESQRRAKQMAKDALEQKLRELEMGKLEWRKYEELRNQVTVQIQQLRNHLKDLKKRSKERVWLKRQNNGELDDSRLVDALTGEKDVFKRRGNVEDANVNTSRSSDPLTLKLIVDISASMYRFNGYDGRLQRLLEASLMIMESLRDDPRFKLYLIGHSGTSEKIPLVNPNTILDEATQLKVLECMVANTQYTYAGDNTVEAIHLAVKESSKDDLLLIISDANLKRYQISADDLAPLQSRDINSYLILIGSLGDEAHELAKAIPNERARVCFKSSDLPLIIKRIVTQHFKNT